MIGSARVTINILKFTDFFVACEVLTIPFSLNVC